MLALCAQSIQSFSKKSVQALACALSEGRRCRFRSTARLAPVARIRVSVSLCGRTGANPVPVASQLAACARARREHAGQAQDAKANARAAARRAQTWKPANGRAACTAAHECRKCRARSSGDEARGTRRARRQCALGLLTEARSAG